MQNCTLLGLSDTGKCVIYLVTLSDKIILYSKALTFSALVKQFDIGLASFISIIGHRWNQTHNNLSMFGVPNPGDQDKLYPVPPTFSHLYPSPTVLSDTPDGASCAIVNYYYYYFYLFTHNVSKSPGTATVVFVGKR